MVVANPAFADLALVDDVLLHTWNDAVQAFGRERPLMLVSGVETAVGRYVRDWVARHQDPVQHVEGITLLFCAPQTDTGNGLRPHEQALPDRDFLWLRSSKARLCLAFYTETR